jgi:hypothetical protein
MLVGLGNTMKNLEIASFFNLFNYAASSTYCLASYDRMINENELERISKNAVVA